MTGKIVSKLDALNGVVLIAINPKAHNGVELAVSRDGEDSGVVLSRAQAIELAHNLEDAVNTVEEKLCGE